MRLKGLALNAFDNTSRASADKYIFMYVCTYTLYTYHMTTFKCNKLKHTKKVGLRFQRNGI